MAFISARELKAHYTRLPNRAGAPLPSMQPFAAWCEQTSTVPETHGDLVAIPHTQANRNVMDRFSDYKVSSIQDGVITLQPRRGNEVW